MTTQIIWFWAPITKLLSPCLPTSLSASFPPLLKYLLGTYHEPATVLDPTGKTLLGALLATSGGEAGVLTLSFVASLMSPLQLRPWGPSPFLVLPCCYFFHFHSWGHVGEAGLLPPAVTGLLLLIVSVFHHSSGCLGLPCAIDLDPPSISTSLPDPAVRGAGCPFLLVLESVFLGPQTTLIHHLCYPACTFVIFSLLGIH